MTNSLEQEVDERGEFVSELIGGLLKVGYDHDETCHTIAMLADVLEAVHASGIDATKFVKQSADKEAISGMVGQSIPWPTIGAAIGNVGNSAMRMIGDTGTRIIDGVAANTPGALILGPVAAGAVGFGAGQLASQLFDDPDQQISEVRHQELLSALRRNARRLKVDRHRMDAASEDTQTQSP